MHNDARPPNFKIVIDNFSEKAFILDFAYSKIFQSRQEPESLDFDFENETSAGTSLKNIEEDDEDKENDHTNNQSKKKRRISQVKI